MPKTVFAIHTTPATPDLVKPLFAEILPAVRLVNLVDDGLLADVRAAGSLTPSVVRRLIGYGTLAESAGADAILSCCSTVGEAMDLLAKAVSIPVVKIDGRMAERAVESGRRIAIIATLNTTLGPTETLLRKTAREKGREAQVRRYLVEGAFDALMAGDTARHDSLLVQAIVEAAPENDVLVLAQGSMSRILSQLPSNLPGVILTSPRLAVEAVRDALADDSNAFHAAR